MSHTKTVNRAGAGALAFVATLGLGLLFANGCDDDDEPAVVKADAAAGAGGGRGGAAGADAAAGGAAGAAGATGRDGGAPDGGPPPLPDLDVAVVRLNANGTPDTTFGNGGTARLDFGPGSSDTVRDSVYGMARDEQGRIVLFGARRADGRTDSDRVVVRLTTAGAPDPAFGTNGTFTLDTQMLADNARHGIVHGDRIVAAGYTPVPTGVGMQTANSVSLLRLDGTGKRDATFGTNGVSTVNPFKPADAAMQWGMAEAYAVRLQGDKYVTTGYGRSAPSGTVDVVSFRFDAKGDLDRTFGAEGIAKLDLIGDNDRGRNLAALPDGRLLVLGSGTPTAMNVDAMAVMMTKDGALDTTFDGDGHKLYSFGRPDEAFFGAAVSADGKWAASAGYRSGPAGGMPDDDDAVILLLPLAGGTEVAKAVPISETRNDRFWAAAFGPDGKLYAAGHLDEGGDTRMVVARYDATGALDTTFGTNGVATINVSVGPGTEETARDIVVQPDGKVVITGPFEKR